MLGRNRPGSEGNLASDKEDTAQSVAPPPDTEDTAENPLEKSEKKMERNDKTVEKSDKPADRTEKPQESKLQDGAKPPEVKPESKAAGEGPREGAPAAERLEGGLPQGHRRSKQGQPQKNGSPTLDLVELKDMSI